MTAEEIDFLERAARCLDGTGAEGDWEFMNREMRASAARRALYRGLCGHAVELGELRDRGEICGGRHLAAKLLVGAIAAAAAAVLAYFAWPIESPVVPLADREESSVFTYPFDGFPRLMDSGDFHDASLAEGDGWGREVAVLVSRSGESSESVLWDGVIWLENDLL